MAGSADFEKLDVFPRDYQSLPETTKFELSDVDQSLTANHTSPFVVYPFNGSKDEVVKNLQAGLQNVITCIPLVGGELLTENGRIGVLRKNHEPVSLGIHHLDRDPDFPSYETLKATGFPAKFFSENQPRLTPPGSNLSGFRRDDGCPVAVFQANFIKGGLILTLPLHHICGDAKSIDHTLKLWADSTRAAAESAPMPTFTPALDRSYFSAQSTPSKEEIEQIKANVAGFTFTPISADSSGAPKVEPPKPPPVSIVMYHFSPAKCDELKRICKPAEGSDVKFVSSYDVISAIVWRSMTRARIPYLKPDLKVATTEYAHPVDSRGTRSGGSVPSEYFGNGFMMIPTKPILMSDLVEEEAGLPKAAWLIRQSIQSMAINTIPDFVSLARGIYGVEEITWIWHPENVIGTSWCGMSAMKAYDFGFGLPASLRLPLPPFEGVLGVLPAKGSDGKEGGYDVYVVLESGCQERLQKDPEFTKYCSEIGA